MMWNIAASNFKRIFKFNFKTRISIRRLMKINRLVKYKQPARSKFCIYIKNLIELWLKSRNSMFILTRFFDNNECRCKHSILEKLTDLRINTSAFFQIFKKEFCFGSNVNEISSTLVRIVRKWLCGRKQDCKNRLA